jgi:hypothetical protein
MRQVEALGMAGRLTELTPNAHRVLLIMALNAHDTGTKTSPARTYFRGWDHLAAAALGRTEYEHADKLAVQRAVADLLDAGFVKHVGRRHGNRHGSAMYELMLW